MKKGFRFERNTFFKGPRRIGLDSSLVIDLIANKELFMTQSLRIFKGRNLVFIHEISKKEVVDKLTEKGYEEAEKDLREFIKNNKIGITPKIENNKYLGILMSKAIKEKIKIHPPDCFIIADFKAFGINKVFATDRNFREGCKLLGIDTHYFSTTDKEIQNQIKKMFKFRRK